MKKIRCNAYAMITVLVMLPVLLTAQSKVGTSAANFLQIGAGARGVGLGEAASASYRDISGIYWNPSLVAYAQNNQVYFNHTRWFADIDLSYGSALLMLGGYGNVAVTFYTLRTDQIEVTTEEYPNGTGALYTAQDMMVALSHGVALTNRFNMGLSLKYINSQIWNNKASAFAADIGLTYKTPLERITLGMSISNFGTEMQMGGTDNAVRFDPDLRVGGNNDGIVAHQRTRSWDLPILFRFGMSYDVFRSESHQVLLLGDVLYPSSQENYVNAGFEYGFLGTYFVRAGHRQLFLNDAEGGFSAGAGLKVYTMRIDYAFSDRGVLNAVQYFSVSFDF